MSNQELEISLSNENLYIDDHSYAKAGKFDGKSYVNIPKIEAYNFGRSAFTVMAYISPQNDSSDLSIGTIISSKPAPGGYNQGGWQLFLEKVNDIHYICFKIDDGFGYQLLRAPLNNLYDNNYKHPSYGKPLSEDIINSQLLFKKYLHFITAVKGSDGRLSIYVNGYLLAQSVMTSSVNNHLAFELTAIYKDAINTPTHFITLKKDVNGYLLGYNDWNADSVTYIGKSFSLDNDDQTRIIDDPEDRKKTGIAAFRVQKIKNVIPAAGMIASEEYVLTVIPDNEDFKSTLEQLNSKQINPDQIYGKPLAQFLANLSDVQSLNSRSSVRIGGHEQYTNFYTGYIKHVSLWNKPLTHQEIISYFDREKSEKEDVACVGYWSLEKDLAEETKNNNTGSQVGNIDFKDFNIILPVYLERQMETNWCWAASALSILEYYNPLTQETQESVVLKSKKELKNEAGNSFEFLKAHTNNFCELYVRKVDELIQAKKKEFSEEENKKIINSFRCAKEDDQIDFDFIKREIANGNPICITVRWWDESVKKFPNGHIVVITGFSDDKLVVNDPIDGIVYCGFEQLLNSYNNSGHLTHLGLTRSHCNRLFKEQNFAIIHGNYKMFFQKDGNLMIKDISDPDKEKYITGTATKGKYDDVEYRNSGVRFFINDIEFDKSGTTSINKQNGETLRINKLKDTSSIVLPLQLDFSVNGDEWDVFVREVISGKKLYSITDELFKYDELPNA